MRIWIFTTTGVESYLELEEKDEITRTSEKNVKEGDIVFIYRGSPHSNVAYFFKAKNNAYKNPNSKVKRDKYLVDIHQKVELQNPIIFSEMKKDPILSQWGPIKSNFIGSFFEVLPNELESFKTLILDKNPELENIIAPLESKHSLEENKIKKWTFAINKDFYNDLKEQDKIKWNSAKSVKKGDIILIYTGSPYSSIGFILEATTDPFEDPEIRKDWKRPAVMVQKIAEILEPIKFSELKENLILCEWGAVKMGFRGSHFKMSDEEWMELQKLILDKNPELESKILDLENGIDHQYDNKQRIWKVAPGNYEKRQKMWPILKEKGYIGVGWFGCESFTKKDYFNFNSIDEVKTEILKCSKKKFAYPNDEMIWNFAKEMKIGDYIVSNNGYNGILGVGIIESNYIGPNESEKLKLDEDEDYFHYRKVKWFILDEIKLDGNKRFFLQKTIEELDNDKWDKIKEAYAQNSQDYEKTFEKMESYLLKTDENICEPVNIIKRLYGEFKDNYYNSEEGIDHLQKYDIERQKVKEYYKLIGNDPQANNTQDPPINHLLPIKEPTIAPVAVGTIAAYGYKNEDLPGLTEAVYSLIQNLIETNDKIQQKELINTFKSGPYKNGFQTAMLTPVLYYLDPYFFFINRKTVNSFRFISKILGKDENISADLVNYIDNNEKLKKLVKMLNGFIPDLNFESFDAFCHWLCTEHLGNYAEDPEKYEKWLLDNCPTIGEINIFDGSGSYHDFLDYLNKEGYYFEPELIENFLLSLKVKPFVILTGNSGTGKTKIAQMFAKYINAKNPVQKTNRYEIVPVGANWTENRHIIGFYNVITDEYQRAPALDIIIESNSSDNSQEPFFLILDEMNLSHVERYFSDFLSAIESKEPIPLHLNDELKEVPVEIGFSDNLFVIGTVNVDETTYMFSPKVLDRSNTIEFLTPSAKGYMNGDKISGNIKGDIAYLENPLSNVEIRSASLSELKEFFGELNTPEGKFWDLMANELEEFQNILKSISFDFGFRVINEIMRFMYVSWVYEGKPDMWDNWQRYFDAQVKQKMLPRIHGSQRTLENALDELSNICENYPTSKDKLEEMNNVLKKQRYVSFTN